MGAAGSGAGVEGAAWGTGAAGAGVGAARLCFYGVDCLCLQVSMFI